MGNKFVVGVASAVLSGVLTYGLAATRLEGRVTAMEQTAARVVAIEQAVARIEAKLK